jgi:hypothetical protein
MFVFDHLVIWGVTVNRPVHDKPSRRAKILQTCGGTPREAAHAAEGVGFRLASQVLWMIANAAESHVPHGRLFPQPQHLSNCDHQVDDVTRRKACLPCLT